MKKPKVLVTRQVANEAIALLEPAAEVKVWESDEPIPRERLLAEVEDAEAVLSMLTERIDEELLTRAKKLRIAANMAVGYDNIDLPACKRRDIWVTNTPDVLTEATADLAFALLMATGRRLIEADRYVRNGEWSSWSPSLMAGQNVYGATLGIIGMGRIGEAVARRAKGFGMRIVYCNRNRKEQAEAETGAEWASMETLLRESDYVVLLTPLTEETRLLMGEQQFSWMKPTSVFINVSRGGTVDESALYQALVSRKIWAAGLDVFQQEPLPQDYPLLSLPNVVALPHIGSATEQTRADMAKLAAANIVAVLEGRKPLTPL